MRPAPRDDPFASKAAAVANNASATPSVPTVLAARHTSGAEREERHHRQCSAAARESLCEHAERHHRRGHRDARKTQRSQERGTENPREELEQRDVDWIARRVGRYDATSNRSTASKNPTPSHPSGARASVAA